jgi:hypothetical protein
MKRGSSQLFSNGERVEGGRRGKKAFAVDFFFFLWVGVYTVM